MIVLKSTGKNLPKHSHRIESFSENSVYRFFLSKSYIAWFIALFTVVIQALIFHVFLNASDFFYESNEWQYSVECPKDSLDCMDTRTRDNYGWYLVFIVVLAFLLRDLANSTMLLYESTASYNIQCLFASLVLMFITVLAFITSLVYLYATGLSNTEILKDSAVLLFLCEIDEKLFSAIQVISPSWVDRVNTESSVSSSNITQPNASSMNPQQDTSAPPTIIENSQDEFRTISTIMQQDYDDVKEKLIKEIEKRHGLEREIEEMRSQINDLTRNMEILMKNKAESKD